MAGWSQTYDDDGALDRARARARRLVVVFALASGALVSAAPLATVVWRAHAGAVALTCGALLTALAATVLVRLAREHRRLWRVELSVRQVVGHDAAGRRRALPWARVSRVDVSSAGLVVSGADERGRRVRIEAPASMAPFTALAHRAVEYAEAHGREVCVEGCPLDRLDLVALYPSLCESPTATA